MFWEGSANNATAYREKNLLIKNRFHLTIEWSHFFHPQTERLESNHPVQYQNKQHHGKILLKKLPLQLSHMDFRLKIRFTSSGEESVNENYYNNYQDNCTAPQIWPPFTKFKGLSPAVSLMDHFRRRLLYIKI